MVASMKCFDRGTNLFDYAHALVPENASGLAGWHIAFEDVKIGAADRRLDHPDDCIGWRGQVGLGAVENLLLARFLINESFHSRLLNPDDLESACVEFNGVAGILQISPGTVAIGKLGDQTSCLALAALRTDCWRWPFRRHDDF